MDLHSRAVVGCAMAPHLRTELVIDALEMAICRRRPAEGLVHHSDQGTQTTSFALVRKLRDSGILASMGAVGTAYDNAAAESFFSTIKRELVHRRRFTTRGEAKSAILGWIEVFYDRRRRHSTIGNVSPAEFERSHLHALTSQSASVRESGASSPWLSRLRATPGERRTADGAAGLRHHGERPYGEGPHPFDPLRHGEEFEALCGQLFEVSQMLDDGDTSRQES